MLPRPTGSNNRPIRREPERMAISFASVLIALVALPFAGSCVAAVLRANARNVEAYVAGGVCLIACALVVASYPRVVDGGVVQYTAPWVPGTRPRVQAPDGRFRMGARRAHRGDRVP